MNKKEQMLIDFYNYIKTKLPLCLVVSLALFGMVFWINQMHHVFETTNKIILIFNVT